MSGWRTGAPRSWSAMSTLCDDRALIRCLTARCLPVWPHRSTAWCLTADRGWRCGQPDRIPFVVSSDFSNTYLPNNPDHEWQAMSIPHMQNLLRARNAVCKSQVLHIRQGRALKERPLECSCSPKTRKRRRSGSAGQKQTTFSMNAASYNQQPRSQGCRAKVAQPRRMQVLFQTALMRMRFTR